MSSISTSAMRLVLRDLPTAFRQSTVTARWRRERDFPDVALAIAGLRAEILFGEQGSFPARATKTARARFGSTRQSRNDHS